MKHIKLFEEFKNINEGHPAPSSSDINKHKLAKQLNELKSKTKGFKVFYAGGSDDEYDITFDELKRMKTEHSLHCNAKDFYLVNNSTGKTVLMGGDVNDLLKYINNHLNEGHEESNEINEGRSIEKIQYDWAKLTTQMQATALNWKAAEGKAKDMLLGKLKDMTAKKKQLEAELDAAIADKDKDIELVIQEGTFYRLPKDVIGNELYVANQSMSSLYSGASAGDDISPKEIDYIIKLLQQVKSLTKKFNSADDVIGTVYEKLNVDIVAKKWDELYGEDLKDDYYDIWKKLKAKGSFTLSDLEKMWDKSYGESFKDQYDGLYKELMNESLVTEGKTDAIYKMLEGIWEDAVDGVEYDENHGYTSRSFSDYWKKNQGKIIANFNKI